MSNIPDARQKLQEARMLLRDALALVDEALAQSHRRKPEFTAPRTRKGLTAAQKRDARRLRKRGLSLMQIATKLKANHGRVSEAISGKAH